MFKKLSAFTILSVLSASAFAASQSAVQSNTSFLNTQLHTLVNDTGVTPVQNWFQGIKVSGLLNLDAFAQNNYFYLNSHAQFTQLNYHQGSQSAFNVSTLALNVDAPINAWVNSHISLFYATAAQPTGISGSSPDNFSFADPTRYYPGADQGQINPNLNKIDIDDAYVDFGDFNRYPIDIRVGRQYFGYGEYDRYAMMPTLTQQMTELRSTGVQLNYVGLSGLSADAFAFRGARRFRKDSGVEQGYMLRDFGGSVNYTHAINKLSFHLNVGYLSTQERVGAMAQFYSSSSLTGGWNANASVATGPIKFGLQYAAAILPLVAFTWDDTLNDTKQADAKPSAGNLYARYAFKTSGYNSGLSLSYQWSKQANTYRPFGLTRTQALFVLPESRVAGEYDINVLKNTMLGFEVNYDSAYSRSHNGSGDGSLTGIARLSVLL